MFEMPDNVNLAYSVHSRYNNKDFAWGQQISSEEKETQGKFEYPIWYLNETKTHWSVNELTGKEIFSVQRPEGAPSVQFILDSDHALTEEGVYSIPKGKKIQDLPELKAHFMERGGERVYLNLPAPEDYFCTETYNAFSVLDPESKIETVVTFLMYSKRTIVWTWNGGKLTKDHELTFNVEIGKGIPLPSKVAGPNKILLRFRYSFIIYDVVERKRVRKVR